MKESNPSTEPIGQNLIKLISNLCFSVFVFSVFVFTVIAITYQPPDPWLESAPALTNFFTKTENASFKDDTSILKTGEDLQAVPSAPSVPPVSSITETVIEKSEEEVKNLTDTEKSDCDELRVVNCSDPRVLIAVERFNLKLFKSIMFLEYQTPVNGSKANECDVAWRFRNKKEKSWRKYRDFRRLRFGYGENCTYKVVRAGGWHSGINARRSFRSRVNSTRSVGNPKVAPAIRDDEINDTIPTLGSETNFRKGRYLYYSRGGDYCKGMNQYMWSFLCGLGEAVYLNRTFVMDLSVCLAATYNPRNKNEEGKDFRYYFDFEHLKEVASIVEEGEFLRDWKKWDRGHKRKVPVKKVVTYKVTPMQLKKDKSTIIWRQFDAPEPENYWYRVCEGQAAKYIQRPWHAMWKPTGKVARIKHFTTENDSKYSLDLLSRAQSIRMDKDLLQGEKDGQGFCEDDHDDSKMCLPVGTMKRRRSDNNETNSGDLLIAGSDKKRKSSPWVGGRKCLQTGTSPLFRQVADISFGVQLNEKFTGGSTEMDTKMVKGATDQFHISSATLLSSEDSNQCSVGSCSSNEFADCPGKSVHKSVENVSNDSDAESSFPSLSGKKHEFPFPSHKLEADIHELELHAYESTVQALYASGPLSWEQESLLTNLRLSLNISDEEHLLQLRHLLSAQVV